MFPSTLQTPSNRARRRGRNDPNSRDYICPCGKSYLSYPALFTHIKIKHNGRAPGQIIKPKPDNANRRGRMKQKEVYSDDSNTSQQASTHIDRLCDYLLEAPRQYPSPPLKVLYQPTSLGQYFRNFNPIQHSPKYDQAQDLYIQNCYNVFCECLAQVNRRISDPYYFEIMMIFFVIVARGVGEVVRLGIGNGMDEEGEDGFKDTNQHVGQYQVAEDKIMEYHEDQEDEQLDEEEEEEDEDEEQEDQDKEQSYQSQNNHPQSHSEQNSGLKQGNKHPSDGLHQEAGVESVENLSHNEGEHQQGHEDGHQDSHVSKHGQQQEQDQLPIVGSQQAANSEEEHQGQEEQWVNAHDEGRGSGKRLDGQQFPVDSNHDQEEEQRDSSQDGRSQDGLNKEDGPSKRHGSAKKQLGNQRRSQPSQELHHSQHKNSQVNNGSQMGAEQGSHQDNHLEHKESSQNNQVGQSSQNNAVNNIEATSTNNNASVVAFPLSESQLQSILLHHPIGELPKLANRLVRVSSRLYHGLVRERTGKSLQLQSINKQTVSTKPNQSQSSPNAGQSISKSTKSVPQHTIPMLLTQSHLIAIMELWMGWLTIKKYVPWKIIREK